MTGRTPPGRGDGQQRLGQLLAGLSDRDLAVIASVDQHRFLTTNHLQQLHFVAHATPLSSSRSCRRVLHRLHDLRLLSMLPRRVGGFRAGSGSSVWFVAPAGQRLLALRRGDGSPSAGRIREPSLRFVDHALAIADCHVAVSTAARGAAFGLTAVEIEPASWRRYLSPAGIGETLKPDLALITTSADGAFEDRWFVEVDLGTEHLPTVLRKCQQYAGYRRTGDEQQRHGVFPIVVWLTRDDRRAAKLSAAIAAARTLDPQLFRVVAAEQLVSLLTRGAA